MFVPPGFTREQARQAVQESRSWAEALRRLAYCHTGNNRQTLQKYVALWGISTDHFDPSAAQLQALKRHQFRIAIPLERILVKGSNYNRSSLKRRLFAEGLKQPVCERCGQGEFWHGRRMGMILDHVNGVRNDNRLENLRIVCPNCAATLDTHCGRKGRVVPLQRQCLRCGRMFQVKYRKHRYCSRQCGVRWDRSEAGQLGRGQFGMPRPETRKVRRPSYEQLLREIKESSYLAVGRKYGVSDNAIRKWIQFYKREHERLERKAVQSGEREAA